MNNSISLQRLQLLRVIFQDSSVRLFAFSFQFCPAGVKAGQLWLCSRVGLRCLDTFCISGLDPRVSLDFTND